MENIREFYKRHAISSSRGTVSTEGILSGYFSLAINSTSTSFSPTATSCSLTTAIALPGYLSTSSLKCSTIQRSSLSIAVSNGSFGYQNSKFYIKSNRYLKKSQSVNNISE